MDSHIFFGRSKSRLSTLSPELHGRRGERNKLYTRKCMMETSKCSRRTRQTSAVGLTLWWSSQHLCLLRSPEHEIKLCGPQLHGCSESHSSPTAWLPRSPLSLRPSEQSLRSYCQRNQWVELVKVLGSGRSSIIKLDWGVWRGYYNGWGRIRDSLSRLPVVAGRARRELQGFHDAADDDAHQGSQGQSGLLHKDPWHEVRVACHVMGVGGWYVV